MSIFYIEDVFNFSSFRINKSKYVYFLNDFNGNTKIGRSSNPILRAKEISCISNKIVFPTFIGEPHLEGNKCENIFHKMLADKRIKCNRFTTEWFSIETYKLICIIYPTINDYFKMAWAFNPAKQKYIPLFEGMIELGIKPKELDK
jgi:hypothetical protein